MSIFFRHFDKYQERVWSQIGIIREQHHLWYHVFPSGSWLGRAPLQSPRDLHKVIYLQNSFVPEFILITIFRFLDDGHVTPGSNGSSMMNPGTNNGSGSSWLFSGPGSGTGFHPADHLQGGHLPPHTTSATFTPASVYDDNNRSGQPTPMLPFSQTDLSFVDSLTIHPSQQKTQQQSQHFVTSSTLHPGSALSVVEASEATGKLMLLVPLWN